MILEGIVTTTNEDHTTNCSPMGPVVEEESLETFQLRPFRTSNTYRNLQRTHQGVLHITDDVESIAMAAIGHRISDVLLRRCDAVDGMILTTACRWLAFLSEEIDDRHPRATFHCRTVQQGRIRDFIGLCRAKHAVIEAAILATRIAFLPAVEIEESLHRLQPLIEKTGGESEQRAFQMLCEYIQPRLASCPSAPK